MPDRAAISAQEGLDYKRHCFLQDELFRTGGIFWWPLFSPFTVHPYGQMKFHNQTVSDCNTCFFGGVTNHCIYNITREGYHSEIHVVRNEVFNCYLYHVL